MIRIRMFKAGSGDCFLVQANPDTLEEVNILIDCGYNYRSGIKPNLKRIITRNKKIDRLIITHYDADHIQGAISLIKENGKSSEPNLFPIEQVWLNTFRHLQFSKRKGVVTEGTTKLIDELINEDKKKNEQDLIGNKSAGQASLLGKELYKNGYKWNEDFKGLAVSPENRNVVRLAEDLWIELLTPSLSCLEQLEKDFINFLNDKGLEPSEDSIFDDAFELYCKTINKKKENLIGNKSARRKVINKEWIEYFSKKGKYTPDQSKENASSISFILHSKNKKILFMGDALSEDIEKALHQAYPEQCPILFDAIKMSHHGSFKNCNPSLLKLIDSKNYLFSTNGKTHHHPDVETIACVVNRGTSELIPKRNLYFNYDLYDISKFKDEQLQKEYKYVYKQEMNILL